MTRDPLQDWLDDIDTAVTDAGLWSTREAYEMALARGVTDVRVVANAIALVETAERMSKDYPNAYFDTYFELLLDGLSPYYSFRWLWKTWAIYANRTFRNKRRQWRWKVRAANRAIGDKVEAFLHAIVRIALWR